MPSIDERLEELENNSRTHDVMLNMLTSIGERQQDILDRQQEMLGRHQEMLGRQQDMLDRQQEMLEEIRRDARQTQRLWVRLAQRYGWLDDDDLFEN